MASRASRPLWELSQEEAEEILAQHLVLPRHRLLFNYANAVDSTDRMYDLLRMLLEDKEWYLASVLFVYRPSLLSCNYNFMIDTEVGSRAHLLPFLTMAATKSTKAHKCLKTFLQLSNKNILHWRWMQDTYAHETCFHLAVENVKVLKTLLGYVPVADSIICMDGAGDSILHAALRFPDSLRFLLAELQAESEQVVDEIVFLLLSEDISGEISLVRFLKSPVFLDYLGVANYVREQLLQTDFRELVIDALLHREATCTQVFSQGNDLTSLMMNMVTQNTEILRL